MTVLTIDIGNTRMKWALYAAAATAAQAAPATEPLTQGAVFLENIDTLAEEQWAALAEPGTLLGCNVAGEAVRRRVEHQLELWDLQPSWVVPQAQAAGVSNGYDHPTRLGADRWTALIGARWHLLARGLDAPALVVMIGTAVTVDALDRTGRFLGGLILPGHGIMLRALESGTAGLRVPTGMVNRFPTNTSDALTSGGNFAITGAIERMHRHLADHEGMEPVTLIAGGAGWKVAPHLSIAHEMVEHLIFHGLLALQAWRQTEARVAQRM